MTSVQYFLKAVLPEMLAEPFTHQDQLQALTTQILTAGPQSD